MKTASKLALILVALAGLSACNARTILLEGNEAGLTKWHGQAPFAERHNRK